MICPYCKEEVKNDAIKCRYCHSVLVPGVTVLSPLETKTNSEGKVTYTADADLVRFAKFAAAVLGTFIVVGTYLFGIKLELTVEKMRTAQTALETSTKALRDRETAAAANAKLESAENRAEALLKEIEQNRATSITLIADMQIRYLQPAEQARLSRVRKTSPEKFRSDVANSKLWPVGATLHVRFLDGTPADKENFRLALGEWLHYANLRADYAPSDHAEIRVSFAAPGSWAMIGTDSEALGDPQSPSINLGFAQPGSPPRNYLHEIGHVLGLIHEVKNPKANLKWDKARVYKSLGGPPNYWTKEQADINLFVPEAYPGSRPFDRQSIMMMDFPAEFFLDRASLSLPADLSDSDEKYIAALYPPK